MKIRRQQFLEMSEKLCLQWNEFQNNIKGAFGSLRESADFVDVTLACEDGYQIEAHKVVLAASSPFFQGILKRNQHSHPLIYMRGMKPHDLMSMVDFLYFGEANVDQENLDTFLAIAEELQLKGLKGSKDGDDHQKEPSQEQKNFEQKYKTTQGISNGSIKAMPDNVPNQPHENKNHAVAIPKTILSSGDLKILDETVKSMMDTSQNMFQKGNKEKGERFKICKVCGKEGRNQAIRNHIEANHLEGVDIPCNMCDKTVRSRNALGNHVSRHH